MPTLTAGAARTVINPPLGIKTAGFSSRVGVVERIESDLTATCLVVEGDGTKIAVVAVDTALITHAKMQSLRGQIAEAIGTVRAAVMVNCSHTHSAPAPPDWIPQPPYVHHWLSDRERAMLRDYEASMLDAVVEAARRADAARQPARLGAGWGECRIGVQRREMGPDGLVFLGEVPDGETDPAVGVIRVDSLDGTPIATLCSYGCHTVVVGPRDRSASPDFPGATRDAIERVTGGTAMFLEACGGDIMPAGGMGWEADCRDAKNRVGTALAGEAIKVAAEVRTHVRRGPRTSLTSLSGISLWPWESVTDDALPPLAAAEEILPLDYIAFPTLEEAEAIKASKLKALDEALATGREADICVAVRFADAAERLVEHIRDDRRTLDTVVQALRIGDIALVGISMEVFAGTGLTIKSRSPFPHTQVLGYTNGCVAYLPRAQDYPPGGWDIHTRYKIPDMLFQSYSVPIAIDPGSEARVVDCARRLLGSIKE